MLFSPLVLVQWLMYSPSPASVSGVTILQPRTHITPLRGGPDNPHLLLATRGLLLLLETSPQKPAISHKWGPGQAADTGLWWPHKLLPVFNPFLS